MENHDGKTHIITIEGMDGAGKNTQSNLLYQVIKRKNIPTEMASFPIYDDPSAHMITKILWEDGIIDHDDNLKYIKTCAYAMNRAKAFFDKDNTRLYNIIKTGGAIVLDRYVTSSILHIASILETKQEVDECIDFIQEIEYDKFKLPRPTQTFFLDVHPDVSLRNIDGRGNTKDLNETPEHLYKVYERSNYVVEKLGWTRIECNNDNLTMKSPLEIHLNICRQLSITK